MGKKMLYNICKYFLCFIFFSFLGWAYESVFYSVQLRKPVNSGFLNGCICPVYGIGGLLLMPVARISADVKTLFLAGMIICSLLEYFTSWLLEKLFHTRWWDYSEWPFNINGRICAVSMLGFGFATLIGTRGIIPYTLAEIQHMPARAVYTFAAFGAAMLFIDLAHTIKFMNKSKDKLWFVEQQSKLVGNAGDSICREMEKIRGRFFDKFKK